MPRRRGKWSTRRRLSSSGSHSVNRAWCAVVTRDGWKYAAQPGQDWLLFHTDEDRYEMANYVYDNAFGAKHRELRERLERWMIETGDEFELPPVR